MLGIKHTAPILMQQKSGSIINNGSVAAHQAGYSSSMIYGAAKAAVNHLSRCAAMELGEHNVRVNSISPGAIATGIVAKALGIEANKADSMADALAVHFAKVQPIPRAGITDDIANCAVYLGLRQVKLRQWYRHYRRRRHAGRAHVHPAPGRAEAIEECARVEIEQLCGSRDGKSCHSAASWLCQPDLSAPVAQG